MFVEDGSFSFDNRVRHEADALTAHGWDVTVICPKYRDDPCYRRFSPALRCYYYPKPNAESAIGHVVEHTVSLALGSLLTAWVALRHGFRVFHGCNPMDILWLLAWPYKLLGRRFIFDQHDLCPEVYLSRGGGREGDLPYRILRWLERRSYRLADAVIATNASYRRVALTRGRRPPESVFIVRNGPDLATYRADTPPAPIAAAGDVLVGYLGNMNIQDGVEYLIAAAEELVLRRGRSDLKFILIGGGSSQAAMTALARAKGLGASLTFTGRIPDADMLPTLAACDICVQPDPSNPLNDKSTMNKIMEYMALCKPVVAFDLEETRVSCGDAALYATPNVVPELADRILALADDPARRAELGRRGRARVEATLAWPYSIPPLLEAYAHAMRARDGARRCMILMIGTSRDSQGGIAAVVKAYAQAGLFASHPIVYVPSHVTGRALRKVIVLVRALGTVIRHLLRQPVRCIHMHTSFRHSFYRKALFCFVALLFRKPFILHVHSGNFVSFFSAAGPLTRRLTTGLFERAAAVIVLSETWQADFRAVISAKANYVVLANPVVLPPQDEPVGARPRGAPFLFVGAVTRTKGVGDLLAALAILNQRGVPAELVIGGDGALEAMRREAKRLNVAEQTRFTGWVSGDAKSALFRDAGCFVLPSHAEGMPVAVLEAMAWGLPVIASAVGGVPELIRHEQNGMLIPPGDPHALAAAMAAVLHDGDQAAALGRQARLDVARFHDPAAITDHLVALYRARGYLP